MINTNILNGLESNFQDPSYSVVISKFEQPEFCNKDQLKIYMQQFSPNLEKIIENNLEIIEELKALLNQNNIEIPNTTYPLEINNCIQKVMTIDSILDYNTTDLMYISRLNGSMDNDFELDIKKSLVKGTVKDRQIIITENDIPNNFNRSKFKIKDDQLIITIPKKIETISIVINKKCRTKDCSNNTISDCEDSVDTFTESNIVNNKISIPINFCKYTYTFALSYTIKDSFITQRMESITTPLKSSIKLGFQYTYKDLPAVIITIDEDKKVYSSYTTKFNTNMDGAYNGVTISFKGLKRQKEYGDVNITIIGAQRLEDDQNDTNG